MSQILAVRTVVASLVLQEKVNTLLRGKSVVTSCLSTTDQVLDLHYTALDKIYFQQRMTGFLTLTVLKMTMNKYSLVNCPFLVQKDNF